MPQSFVKDPQAILDYAINWATWLGADAISSSVWEADDGITIVSHSHDATTATVWLSGGTHGVTYNLTCHIVTAAGREDDRTITVKVYHK